MAILGLFKLVWVIIWKTEKHWKAAFAVSVMFTEDIEGDSESETGEESKSSRKTCKYFLKL